MPAKTELAPISGIVQLGSCPSIALQVLQDISPLSGIIDYLQSKNVYVNIDSAIHDADVNMAYHKIYWAVEAYDQALPQIGLPFLPTMNITFLNILNKTTLDDGRLGVNTKWIIDSYTGLWIFKIDIALGGLRGGVAGYRANQQGVRLVAHELGHNLTHQEITYHHASDDRDYFGVRAASVPDLYEFSADAFASWALNWWNHTEINQDRARGVNISAELLRADIGQCIVDPNSTACQTLREGD